MLLSDYLLMNQMLFVLLPANNALYVIPGIEVFSYLHNNLNKCCDIGNISARTFTLTPLKYTSVQSQREVPAHILIE